MPYVATFFFVLFFWLYSHQATHCILHREWNLQRLTQILSLRTEIRAAFWLVLNIHKAEGSLHARDYCQKKGVKTEAAVWKLWLQRFQPCVLWLFLGLTRDVTAWCEINYTAVGSNQASPFDRSANTVRNCARTSNFLCCAASQVFP